MVLAKFRPYNRADLVSVDHITGPYCRRKSWKPSTRLNTEGKFVMDNLSGVMRMPQKVKSALSSNLVLFFCLLDLFAGDLLL